MTSLGVPTDEFDKLARKEECRRRLQIPDNVNVIVFLGRFAAKGKGLDVLLEATAHISRDGLDVMLLLVGDGKDARDLQRRAQGLGIAHAVRFLGFWPHPGVLVPMRAADVFVHPSRWDGLGLA